jgi:hypothetical protein
MSYRSLRKSPRSNRTPDTQTLSGSATPKNLPRRIKYEFNVFENSAAFANYFKLALAAYLILAVYEALFKGQGAQALASVFVVGAAAIPIGLWANKKTHGLPIFPVSTFTFVITFGLQFLVQEEFKDVRERYLASSGDIIFAGFTVGLFILSGTLTWFSLTKNRRSMPTSFAELLPGRGDILFVVLFFISTSITALIAMEKFPDLGRFLFRHPCGQRKYCHPFHFHPFLSPGTEKFK